jgi:hypothetical protein
VAVQPRLHNNVGSRKLSPGNARRRFIQVMEISTSLTVMRVAAPIILPA